MLTMNVGFIGCTTQHAKDKELCFHFIRLFNSKRHLCAVCIISALPRVVI
jgi:hypothetical protein